MMLVILAEASSGQFPGGPTETWREVIGTSLSHPMTPMFDYPIARYVAAKWEVEAEAEPESDASLPREGQIEEFLEKVYMLVALNDEQGATDLVFDYFDRLLSDGASTACDAVLRKVDVDRLSTSLMRSFLSITAAAKRKLPSRIGLYWEIKQAMFRLKGPVKTERLLGRLA